MNFVGAENTSDASSRNSSLPGKLDHGVVEVAHFIELIQAPAIYQNLETFLRLFPVDYLVRGLFRAKWTSQ